MHHRWGRLAGVVAVLSLAACRRGHAGGQDTAPGGHEEIGDPPLEVRTVDVPGDEPAFVLLGPHGACPRIVFLHGMCTHGLGYIQAFQRAGRDHGGVLGIQGDLSCGGAFSRYKPDPAALDARIARAFTAIAGPQGPCAIGDGLVVAGYSQGAYLAERMASLFPDRYTELVLIGAPTTPSPGFLRRARGVVNISGEFDATYRMRDGTKALVAAGVPSTYLEMPGARHGELPDAEHVMGEALDWLDANAR